MAQLGDIEYKDAVSTQERAQVQEKFHKVKAPYNQSRHLYTKEGRESTLPETHKHLADDGFYMSTEGDGNIRCYYCNNSIVTSGEDRLDPLDGRHHRHDCLHFVLLKNHHERQPQNREGLETVCCRTPNCEFLTGTRYDCCAIIKFCNLCVLQKILDGEGVLRCCGCGKNVKHILPIVTHARTIS